jgi:hypothetical protein
MDNTLLLELSKCLDYAIKQVGLIHFIKHKLVLFSISNGLLTVQFALLQVEMEL